MHRVCFVENLLLQTTCFAHIRSQKKTRLFLLQTNIAKFRKTKNIFQQAQTFPRFQFLSYFIGRSFKPMNSINLTSTPYLFTVVPHVVLSFPLIWWRSCQRLKFLIFKNQQTPIQKNFTNLCVFIPPQQLSIICLHHVQHLVLFEICSTLLLLGTLLTKFLYTGGKRFKNETF